MADKKMELLFLSFQTTCLSNRNIKEDHGQQFQWELNQMMSDEPYHNKGFGLAFLAIVFFMLVFPAMVLFATMGTWDMFWKMHLPHGDCWENNKHEKVCKDAQN